MMKIYRNFSYLVIAILCILGVAALGRDDVKAADEEFGRTAQQVVEDMGHGINLGNVMESYGTWIDSSSVSNFETAWGSPIITKAMITGMKNAGFTSIRIPVSWSNMMSKDGKYTINSAYFNRVDELVGYALDNGMYVIINDHYDSGWWTQFISDYDGAMKRYVAIWTQVADHYKNYGEKLIFESANEELTVAYNSWEKESENLGYTKVNAINQKFVDLVRSSGGNNGERYLLIAGANTDINKTVDSRFKMPKDTIANHLMISIHYYDPLDYALLFEDTDWAKAKFDWGTDAEKKYMADQLKKMKTAFTDKGYGVIVGEYSVCPEYISDGKYRRKNNDVEFLELFNKLCDEYGFAAYLWNTEDWYNKSTCTMRFADIASVFGPVYSVNFNGNGNTSGSMNSPANVACGYTYTIPANGYNKTGYSFIGWNTKADGTGKAYANKASVKDIAKVNSTITLYAQWKLNQYTITYNLNGGKNSTSNPASYNVNTSTITLASPTKTGYTFGGWYTDSKFTKKVTSIVKGSTGNKTLYAKWTLNTYKIAFNGNGSTSGSMSALTGRKYGTTYTLTANAFAKKGYTFAGWNTKTDGTGTTYANKAQVKNLTTKNGVTVTLYAKWKLTKYTITYNLNGGKNSTKNPAAYYFTTNTITLANPTRTGYTFGGWYSDSKFTKKVTSIVKGSTGSRTLYAKWTVNKYKIVFNGNGSTSGSMSALTARKYGTTYTLPANAFKKKGYTFAGWNTKKDGTGTTYANKAQVKSLTSKNGATVTLYAKWKLTKYKVTYVLNGGKNTTKNVATYTIKRGVVLYAPSRTGYTFLGWYSDKTCTKKVTSIKTGTVGNKTLYAKWKKK